MVAPLLSLISRQTVPALASVVIRVQGEVSTRLAARGLAQTDTPLHAQEFMDCTANNEWGEINLFGYW
jgi:hypothetical protein